MCIVEIQLDYNKDNISNLYEVTYFEEFLKSFNIDLMLMDK